MVLAPHIAPPTFISSVNALAIDTRALVDLTPGMVDLVTDGTLPDEIEPLIDLGGSMKRPTVSLFPGPQKTEAKPKMEEAITPGFDGEREHLQELVDKHVHAHLRHGFPASPEVPDEVRRFLTRLVSVTGLPLHRVLGSEDMAQAKDKLEWIGMVGGLRSFALLDVPAKQALNIYMGTDNDAGWKMSRASELPPAISGPADLASRYFESALCYMALGDEYAKEAVEGRFFVASSRYVEAGLLNAAAISSDLASRWWRPAPFKESGKSRNPHHSYAAKLFAESIRANPDPFNFSTRYLYGLHHSRKAADFTSMEKLFGASSGYFKRRKNPFEAAKAHIREAWAFSQRTDIDADDWLGLSANLRSALELFSDSWMERDAKTVARLKDLSFTASNLSGRG